MKVDTERLAEIRAADVPRASLDGFGERLSEPSLARLMAADVARAVDEHLSHYALALSPTGKVVCPGCAVWSDGTTEALGAFKWGLVHGSGSCVRCGWPGRLYHRVDVDGREIRFDLLLWAHPDEVSLRGAS